MRRISEEESEEINKTMERFDAIEESKKLKEPDIEEKPIGGYHFRKAKVRALMGALAVYGTGLNNRRTPYVAAYTPVNIKGPPGIYNKEKHMSRAQRKKMKSRRNKK